MVRRVKGKDVMVKMAKKTSDNGEEIMWVKVLDLRVIQLRVR